MNKLMKKAAAFLTAGLMAAASLGAEAFAESSDTAKSAVVTAAYEAAVAKPTYTIKGSKGVRKIKLSTTTTNATIYYTTNGTVPTASSRKYTKNTLLKITKNTKIKAIAISGSSQSAVMTKTFKVATMYGDVTGDGNINQNDYARLTNYLNRKTDFVCLDNADCNASGGVASNDLTILSMYLNNSISKLPYTGVLEDEEDPEDPEEDINTNTSTNTIKLGKPGITVYKSLGGKKIEFSSSTSGVTFYYTLDGSTPTTKSTRYTDKFLISTAGTKTVKVIAAKSGSVSDVQQTSVTVGTTGPVASSSSTAQVYSGETNIALTCSTSGSTIFYTTDGTDPRTSNTTRAYTAPFNIAPAANSNKVIVKAYARSKANADSAVATFEYNFTTSFVLSGTVWNDTPTASSVADGLKSVTESGISGLRVLALNTATNAYVKDTTTDSQGNYQLAGLNTGSTYKVVFEFNGQKYRPYASIVSGGNQALLTNAIPPMTVKNSGAFNSTTNSVISNYNSYTNAINSSDFNTTASTNATYKVSTPNINLALTTNNYGSIGLAISTTSSSGVTGQVKNNDRVTYTVTLTNNSPSAALSDITLGFYFTDSFKNISMYTASGYTVNTTNNGLRSGYRDYTINNLLGSGSLDPGKSTSFTFTGYVEATDGVKLNCSVEVNSYRFASSVYDQYSIPGNMTVGTKRENDEAVATTLQVSDNPTPAADSTISASTRSFTLGQGDECEFEVLISNVTSTSQYIISPSISPAILVTWDATATQLGDNMLVKFHVKANTGNTQGPAYFTIYLKENTSIYTTVTVTVTR